MQKRKTNISAREIFNGDIWTRAFIRRQYKLFGLIIFLFLLSINNGYQCEKQHIKITQLEKDLRDVQYEYITLNAELVSISRQSTISQRLQANGSRVKESSTPPIKLNH